MMKLNRHPEKTEMTPGGSRATSGPVLSATSIGKRFSGLQALSAVDLDIFPGEIVGIIGPNGAGKSTLINVLSGLYRPDGGRIVLDGAEITNANASARARMGLSRTFQHTRALSSFTVREAIRLAYSSPRVRRRMSTNEIHELAARFGLDGYLNRLVPLLPYGAQKVLNIALISLCNPKVVLLDEPFAGVTTDDIESLSQVISDLRAVGVGVALVEHDMISLMRLSDRVVVLDAGTTVASGTPVEVQANELVREIYLGGSSKSAAAKGAAGNG
jgi:branched-chain amino acid transport system ATP-binding protein